jgi:hypothetical protein
MFWTVAYVPDRGKGLLTINSQQQVTAVTQAISATPRMSGPNKQTNNLAQRARDSVPANKSGTVNVAVDGAIISNLELST